MEESGQENVGGAKDRTEDIDRINKLNVLPIKNNRHNDLVYFILNKEFGL